MRTIENYELVLSGESEDRLLLTFDWEDLPQIPKNVTHAMCDKGNSEFRITFEDKEHWEEVHFVKMPATLLDMVQNFSTICVIGLSDKVEMFGEVTLEHKS